MEKRNGMNFRHMVAVTLVVTYISMAAGGVATARKDSKKQSNVRTKRLDDSYSSALFGGWTPMKPRNPYSHGSQSSKYHDLIPAEQLDTSSSYYSSSLPQQNKDIYNYYPRPAIKSKPKSKVPVYMETFRPKNKKYSSGGMMGFEGIPGLEGIDINQLKHLQEVLLSAHHQLPLTHLNLPLGGGKDVKFIEIAIQSLPGYGGSGPVRQKPKGKSGYRQGGRRNRGRGSHQRTQQPHLPINVQYLQVPHLNTKDVLNYEVPKDIPILPVQVPGVEEVIDLKNVQIVEVPVPSIKSVHSSEYVNIPPASDYGKRIEGSGYGGSAPTSQDYGYPSPKTSQQQFPPKSESSVYFQPTKSAGQYPPPAKQQKSQEPKYSTQQQQQQHPQSHHIAAELVEITEDQIKSLVKSIQAAGKDPREVLTYVPLSHIKDQKDGNVHLVLAVPPDHVYPVTEGKQIQYEVSQPPSEDSYGYQAQVPSNAGYESSGYQVHSDQQDNYNTQGQDQGTHQLSAGYQVSDNYQQDRPVSYHQPVYPDGRGSTGSGYAQAPKQESSYQQQQSGAGNNQGGIYDQSGASYDGGTVVGYKRDGRGQAYIEVHAQPDENGFRREPVLAVELKNGQTVEDAIQALDAETLQRLGAHSTDGVEIEVVEIPVDEYAAESRKKVTIVPRDGGNSTVVTTADTAKSTTKTSSFTTTTITSTTTSAPS